MMTPGHGGEFDHGPFDKYEPKYQLDFTGEPESPLATRSKIHFGQETIFSFQFGADVSEILRQKYVFDAIESGIFGSGETRMTSDMLSYVQTEAIVTF